MRKVSFIHTADIHLGSILNVAEGSLPADLEGSIREAVLEGFRRVCRVALDNKVDFILIAGDLYDRQARSVRAQEFFVEQCRILNEAGIDVFVIAGNHDPLQDKQDLFSIPANVRTFRGEKPEIFEFMGPEGYPLARLVGQSYQSKAENRKLHIKYDRPGTGAWNIALLHTQLEAPTSNYIPATLAELKERTDIHYWALGHIHKREILHDRLPFIAYPGIPQGRHFGEQGRGGCLLVELAGQDPAPPVFIPTAPLVYERVEIRVGEDLGNVPTTVDELAEKIANEGEKILAEADDGNYPLQGFIVEWVIRGRSEIYNQIEDSDDEKEVKESIVNNLRRTFADRRPFLWTNAVSLQLQSPLNLDALLKGSRAMAEIDSIIDQYRTDEKIKKELIKELGAIWRGHGDEESYEARDDLRFHLEAELLADFLAGAREMIMARLAEGRD